jgi:serine/threonine protein kinase
MPFAQEGRKAVVYQLGTNGSLYALKVFKPLFRQASLVGICQTLSQLDIPGLEVCNRECLTLGSADRLLQQYPDLEYAVLMPWVRGSTWFDIVYNRTAISENASKKLAKCTADVLAGLEGRGYAHCDVAAGNVIVDTATGKVSFIDVEDMFGPGLSLTGAFPQGSPGYQHRSISAAPHGQWCAEGDRFSAAVLLAEMLAWHDPKIRKASDQEHFFAENELQDPSSVRYRLMVDTLKGLSRDVADCFARAWVSQTLADCPSLEEWAKLLEFPLVSDWLPIPAPPPPPPYKPSAWIPIEVSPPAPYNPTFVPIESNATPESPPPPPKMPVYFRITKSSDGLAYVLQWLPVEGAEGYIIEASDDGSFAQAVRVYQGSEHSWTDPIQPGRVKYYRVCAYNALGTSEWSPVEHTWD